MLPTGGVAIDAGANVGWHAMLMAQLAGPQGRVLAIEANPSIREKLLHNIAINRFTQVQVIPCAAADAEKTVIFHGPTADDPTSASGHVIPEASIGGETLRVEARTIHAIAEERGLERLDLIKLDVEGFEWHLNLLEIPITNSAIRCRGRRGPSR
jgi:FkbM family methyltransferase